MGSATAPNAVSAGFRLSFGSWNTLWIRARSRLRTKRDSETGAMSVPSNTMAPSVGSISRASNRTMVDLPQPDSPTNPRLSPRPIERSTPSTA